MVAEGAVLTLALVPTVGTIPAGWAFLITLPSSVPGLTDAFPRHRVTAPVTVAAVAAIHTVGSPVTAVTSSPAVVSSKSRWASTPAGLRVTLAVILTEAP